MASNLNSRDTMVNWSAIGSMLVANLGGWAGALTMAGEVKRPDGKAWYQLIKKPSWNPPNWVFGPAWTLLYCGMGTAAYLVYTKAGGVTDESVIPLALYGGQLILNWTWTPVFFRLHKIRLAFYHILALDVAATACAISFFSVSQPAGLLMLPYLGWLSFATCLNYSISKLNDENSAKNE